MHAPQPLMLDERGFAERLGVSPETIRKWRKTGNGPPFVKLGTGRTAIVRYRLAEIERWLESCARRSTSDNGAAT